MTSSQVRRVDPQPPSGFNLIPFAVMAGGWLAPMALFWLYVWGPLRPFDYPSGNLLPGPGFALLAAASIALWWLLPDSYFRIRSFERDGRLYQRLGVLAFRRWVPDGDLANRWARRTHPDYRVIPNRRSAAEFVVRTEQSERGHIVLLALGLAAAIHALRIGWTGWALYLTAGNLVVNVYPILLQRYTRSRFRRILARKR